MRRQAGEYPFYDIPGPIAIVHRGGDAAGAEKENSMAAFESADRAGITYAETDTIVTADGVPLAFHGSNNEKTVRKTGLPLRMAVEAMTYTEVQEKLRVGGEPLPALEEVLTAFPDMRFFIDPKTDAAVRPLASLISKLQAQDRVSVGSFFYSRTKAVANELLGGQGELPTCLAKLGTLAMLGLGSNFTASFAKPYLTRSEATSLQVPHNIVTAKMVERAHDLGIKVITWAYKPEINDNKAYMERALSQGVHGLMSDHTEEMKEIILSHDMHNESIRN